jgi:predicted dinucleotide-binding enzyme
MAAYAPMKIAIVGTGDMGSAIATAFVQRSKHDVSVRGSRRGSPSALRLARHLGITEAGDQALRDAAVVFVVVPWEAIDAVSHLLAGCRGIIVSVVVPWTNGDPRTDMTSAAEKLAGLLPHARVVNAFTSVSSSVVREPGSGEKPSVIVCSDDDKARRAVMRLAEELGFSGVNGGGLRSARYAEGMGLLWASLAYDAGYGERVAYRVFVAGKGKGGSRSRAGRRRR